MLCSGTEISPQRGKGGAEQRAEVRSRERRETHGTIAEAQPLTHFGLFVALLSVAALEVISKRPMAPQGC